MEAEALYRRFKSSRSRAARNQIKQSLLEYNGDDLRALSRDHLSYQETERRGPL